MNKCYTTAFDICEYYWIDLVLVHSCSRRVSSILSFSAEGYSNVSTIIFLLKPKRLVLRVMKDDKQLTVWKLLHRWICTVFLPTACELILVFQVGNPMSSKMLPLIRSDLWLDLWWGNFFFSNELCTLGAASGKISVISYDILCLLHASLHVMSVFFL